MTWHPNGILRKAGVLDFAGGTVVHLASAVSALAAAVAVGPRKAQKNVPVPNLPAPAAQGTSTTEPSAPGNRPGKRSSLTTLAEKLSFRKNLHQTAQDNPEAPENAIEKAPANIPFVFLGTAMLWFGWFGFNGGSALTSGHVAVSAIFTTNTSAASALLTWILADYIHSGKPSCVGACTGAVVGLVAITPAAGYVSVGASILIGNVTAIICFCFIEFRVLRKVDDTLDVFAW
jgi:ammonium transporter, Amt family